jgi:hypothetical protein
MASLVSTVKRAATCRGVCATGEILGLELLSITFVFASSTRSANATVLSTRVLVCRLSLCSSSIKSFATALGHDHLGNARRRISQTRILGRRLPSQPKIGPRCGIGRLHEMAGAEILGLHGGGCNQKLPLRLSAAAGGLVNLSIGKACSTRYFVHRTSVDALNESIRRLRRMSTSRRIRRDRSLIASLKWPLCDSESIRLSAGRGSVILKCFRSRRWHCHILPSHPDG